MPCQFTCVMMSGKNYRGDKMDTLSWDHPSPHVMQRQVSIEHIDVMKHTNNVVYQQWMEDVAWSHSLTVGLGPAEYEDCGFGMVVRRHELNYLAATYLGDELLIATWLLEVDKLSTQRVYQICRVSDGLTVFRGATHLVCVEIATGKLKRMPTRFYQAYSSLQIKTD